MGNDRFISEKVVQRPQFAIAAWLIGNSHPMARDVKGEPGECLTDVNATFKRLWFFTCDLTKKQLCDLKDEEIIKVKVF